MSRSLASVAPDQTPAIRAVVFDVGGVLIDWNPRYLYRKLIPDEVEMERFLADVCTLEWHAQHDVGIQYADTIPVLVAAHPEWANEIRAWSERFNEMYGGAFDERCHFSGSCTNGGSPWSHRQTGARRVGLGPRATMNFCSGSMGSRLGRSGHCQTGASVLRIAHRNL